MMNLMTHWFDQLTKTYPWLGWLKINLGVKRWIVLLLGGIVALGVGIAFALVELYQGGAMPLPLDVLTMQFLPRWFRRDSSCHRRHRLRRHRTLEIKRHDPLTVHD